MNYKPRKAPEGINSSIESPLKDALFLSGLTLSALTIGLVVLFFVSNSLVQKIDFETEIRFLQSPFNSKKIDSNQKLQELVDALWSHYPESKKAPLRASIHSSEQVNAFMAIGGRLAVTKGLIEAVDYENELAFVICHEIGHFYHRDVLKSMGRRASLAFLISFAGISNSFDFVNLGIDSLALAFDRNQESKADAFAIDCMNRHYGHVSGYNKFFETVLKKEKVIPQSGRKILSFTQSHPLTETRIKKLEQQIKNKNLTTNKPLSPLAIYP